MITTFKSRQVRGESRGKKLGFPTINLVIPESLTIPYGVYAARVCFGGESFVGALHFGAVPVFRIEVPSLEVFIIDATPETFSDTLIASVQVDILAFIRPVMNFPDAEALTSQIARDVEAVRTAAE